MSPKKKRKREIKAYSHDKEERKNNPQVGLVNLQKDPNTDEKQSYQHDPHLDPQLQWSGKSEHTSFEVPTVSLHVHERIDPRTIIEAVRKTNGNGQKQGSLFDNEANIPLRHAIEFYKHARNWSNRLIAGDSLLIMNSLLQKENMAGKVQCVYMDPPYGIKYSSNFQPFVNKREVTDGKSEDLTTEPEMIKAFRDTWELGIHSYLSYLRDRLLLAKELLGDSGSCFVQIGDENVHRVGMVMDDIFGAENRVATITFATTSSSVSKTLPEVADYLLWYAKDKAQVKYRQLYEKLSRTEIIKFFSSYVGVELADGSCRKLTDEERFDPDKFLPEDARIYKRTGLDSQGKSNAERSEPYHWKGRTFHCAENRQWSISKKSMDKLNELGRLEASEEQASLAWKKYEDEVPGKKISNLWPAQMYPAKKHYVVETSIKAIARCILMTTDPGDLVLDPTCGSGATAYVAEQWGRRWITCDTSRVSTTLAKQRLMTAIFDYYQLAYPDEGIGGGFDYPSLKKVSAGILAGTMPAQEIYLYDQPAKDSKKARVTGPFTVEAVPSPIVQPIDDVIASEPAPVDETVARSGATLRHSEWCNDLLKTGIRGKGGQRISFSRIESWPGRWIHADAETRPDDSGAGVSEPAPAYTPVRAVLSFGPEHGLLESRQVEAALQEADKIRPTPQMVIFAAFQFDPEAAKDIDKFNWPNVSILKVQMNADLQTEDLKRGDRTSDCFWLIGQPEVVIEPIRKGDLIGQWQVKLKGFDYFNTKTGEIESGDEKRIAVWMLDTDYDGRSLYPKQVFFPMAADKDGWTKLAKSLRAEIDEGLIESYKGTLSLPFELGEHSRIAVKVVDDRGIESLKVIEVIPEKRK